MIISHSHSHSHDVPNHNRAFALGVLLNLAFIAIEVYYGIRADSLALIADAGHNFSDVLSLLLAWGANLLAGRKPSARRTYGLRRVTILAALFSSILLLIALGAIIWEAIERLQQPVSVDAVVVMIVAGAGVVINTLTALLFHAGREKDLNIKAAYMHMAADAAVSLGVVIAAAAIVYTNWLWLDPAISLLVTALILVASMGVLRDSFNLAVDAVPVGIDPDAVRDFLLEQSGVDAVHDFHIWGMSTTQIALTAHLVMPDGGSDDAFLQRLAHQLQHRFSIDHTTIQVERGEMEKRCQAHLGCS